MLDGIISFLIPVILIILVLGVLAVFAGQMLFR